MKLTLKTDYSFRVLIFLLREEKSTIKEIADFYNISKNHLSVAVNKLSELGYVLSTRGPGGGIEINPKALEKTVYELVSRIEDFDLVECFNSKTNSCTLSPQCRLKSMFNKANMAFLNELKNHKIKDLK